MSHFCRRKHVKTPEGTAQQTIPVVSYSLNSLGDMPCRLAKKEKVGEVVGDSG